MSSLHQTHSSTSLYNIHMANKIATYSHSYSYDFNYYHLQDMELFYRVAITAYIQGEYGDSNV